MTWNKESFPLQHLGIPHFPTSQTRKSLTCAEVLWVPGKGFRLQCWPSASWVRRTKLAWALTVGSQRLSDWGSGHGQAGEEREKKGYKSRSLRAVNTGAKAGGQVYHSTWKGEARTQWQGMANILLAAASGSNSSSVSQTRIKTTLKAAQRNEKPGQIGWLVAVLILLPLSFLESAFCVLILVSNKWTPRT